MNYLEFYQIHLKTARSYVAMARSMRSQYYLRRAKETLSLARTLIAEKNKDNTLTMFIYNKVA